MAESKFVVFMLGEERFGLPIESVERILPGQAVTKLPRTPKMLLGVFELRGTTLPALDARLRFDMAENEGEANFVVVVSEEGRCALRVDRVDGIVNFTDEDIDSNPGALVGGQEEMVRGIGKQGELLTLLLEPEHIVPKNLKSKLAAA